LHVHANDDAEPDEINAQFCATGARRDDDEGNLKEIDETAEHKHQRIDGNEKSPNATRKARHQLLHPDMAVHAVKVERENSRADKDEHDKAGKPRGAVQRIA
jgi:hypothetical protein